MDKRLEQKTNRALAAAAATMSQARDEITERDRIIEGQALLIRKQDTYVQELEQDLALASSRITELEDQLDSFTEAQEAPHA